MKIIHSNFDIYVNDGVSSVHANREPLSSEDMLTLKKDLVALVKSKAKKFSGVVRSLKDGAIGVIYLKHNKFLSISQSEKLREDIEAKGIEIVFSSNKEITLCDKKGKGAVKVILACGSSNFAPIEQVPTAPKYSRAARLEIRNRVKQAFSAKKTPASKKLTPKSPPVVASVAPASLKVASLPPSPAVASDPRVVPLPQPTPSENLRPLIASPPAAAAAAPTTTTEVQVSSHPAKNEAVTTSFVASPRYSGGFTQLWLDQLDVEMGVMASDYGMMEGETQPSQY